MDKNKMVSRKIKNNNQNFNYLKNEKKIEIMSISFYFA